MAEPSPQPTTGAETIVWDLSIFYSRPEDPAIEADMAAVDADIEAFAQATTAAESRQLEAAGLLAAMERVEALLDRVYRLETLRPDLLYVNRYQQPGLRRVAAENDRVRRRACSRACCSSSWNGRSLD